MLKFEKYIYTCNLNNMRISVRCFISEPRQIFRRTYGRTDTGGSSKQLRCFKIYFNSSLRNDTNEYAFNLFCKGLLLNIRWATTIPNGRNLVSIFMP